MVSGELAPAARILTASGAAQTESEPGNQGESYIELFMGNIADTFLRTQSLRACACRPDALLPCAWRLRCRCFYLFTVPLLTTSPRAAGRKQLLKKAINRAAGKGR